MNQPKNAVSPADSEENLTGDYRRHLRKNFLGRWDLQNPDGSYFDAIVEVEWVRPYPCKSFPMPVHLARKKAKEAERSGRPPKPEFLIKFLGKRKPWILRNDGMRSVADALGTSTVKEWTGKKLALHFDPTIKFGSNLVGGIRALPIKGSRAIEASLENEPDEAVADFLDHAFENEFDEGTAP